MGDDIKAVMREIMAEGERAPWNWTWHFALYSFAFKHKPVLCRPNAYSCYFRMSVKKCRKGTAVCQTNAERREQPSTTPVKALTRPRLPGSIPAFPVLVDSTGSRCFYVKARFIITAHLV